MIANSSCDWPNIDPFFSLTPTTRKWRRLIERVLSIGSTGPKSRLATSAPMTTTGRTESTSTGLISRPRSAVKVANRM